MSILRVGAIAGAALFLWGCSSGTDDAASAAAMAAKPARAEAAPAATAPVTQAEVLAWAEGRWPAAFGGPSQDLSGGVYDYRHYTSTGNDIGFDGDRVFAMGPVTGGGLYYAGHLLDFACLAKPELCAVDRARSDMQVQWQAIAMSPGGYSTFTSVGSPPSHYFFATRRMANPPRATAEGAAIDSIVSAQGPWDMPVVPAAFWHCESPWLRVILDERGHPVDWCHSAALRTQFIGDAIYLSVMSRTGEPLLRYQMTSLTEEALEGRSITTWLRNAVDVLHPLRYVLDSARMFPISSRGGIVTGRRLTGIVSILNPDGSRAVNAASLVPLAKSEDPLTLATTLEDIYGPLPADGITWVNGRRGRFASEPAPGINNGSVEIGGRVYRAHLEYPDPTPRPVMVYLNSFARQGVLQWGLDWPQ